MKIITDVNNYRDFNFWADAKTTAASMTYEEIEMVFSILDDCYPEGMTDTQLNDFFWFDTETIEEWIGHEL